VSTVVRYKKVTDKIGRKWVELTVNSKVRPDQPNHPGTYYMGLGLCFAGLLTKLNSCASSK
jgi:hypothetical protein